MIVTGTGASPGNAKGPVFAITGETLPQDVPRGAILVARVIHPYMSPLFFSAAGVVVEDGGLLQHAAILAREFRLPAVVGVVDAVALLGSASTLEIDGTTGDVTAHGTDQK